RWIPTGASSRDRRLLAGVHELDAVTLILEGVDERLPAILFAFVLDGRIYRQRIYRHCGDHKIPRKAQAHCKEFQGGARDSGRGAAPWGESENLATGRARHVEITEGVEGDTAE